RQKETQGKRQVIRMACCTCCLVEFLQDGCQDRKDLRISRADEVRDLARFKLRARRAKAHGSFAHLRDRIRGCSRSRTRAGAPRSRLALPITLRDAIHDGACDLCASRSLEGTAETVGRLLRG